ncbi:response regulator [Rheinheimera sp. WS51]|uniref:response regulator n=1 Tax=Rheinheimera sp. WS51 TaxID=3425886 RepID=UPI003D8ED2B7
MVNHFRQLTLPWLVAVSLMLLFTALWYQYEAKLQQRAQIQQFSAALQLSVAPYLANRNYQAISNHLTHAGAVSRLPIQATALLSKTGAVLALSQASNFSEKHIQQQYFSTENSTNYQLQKVDHLLVSVQPVSALQHSSAIDKDFENIGQYYLLIIIDNKPAVAVWLLPMLVVFLIGLITLIWIKNSLVQQQQRQQIDIGLVAHKLRQLQQGQYNCRIDEELTHDLEPVKQSFNKMAEQYTEQHSVLQQNLQDQTEELSQARLKLSQTNDVMQQLITDQVKNKAKLAYSIHGLQVLCHNRSLLASEDLSRLISKQLFLMQLLINDEKFLPEKLLLTEFIANELSEYRKRFTDKNIELVVFESPANAIYVIDINPTVLGVLLSSLLEIAVVNTEVSQVVLRIDLKVEQAAFELSVVSDGEGLSLKQQKLFEAKDFTGLGWQDVDYAILAALGDQLSITKHNLNLAGLGCTIKLDIPVTVVEQKPIRPLASILVFDTDLEYLQERKNNLMPLATQVTYCSDLASLEFKAKQANIDTVIVFLPIPESLTIWQQAIQNISKNRRVYCYASLNSVEVWRQALGHLIQEELFCLNTLLSSVDETKNTQLLVVDDNLTNLAFIRVLMKDKPIDLTLVSSGQEALDVCAVNNFDVILLDIQLPDIHGIEIAKQLRMQPAYQDVPILAFTAHALESEKAEFLAAGMNDVILKPLQADKLEQILQWCDLEK